MAVSLLFGDLPSLSEEESWSNDVLQAVMVLLCVYAGWFFWSVLLRCMFFEVNLAKPRAKVVEDPQTDNQSDSTAAVPARAAALSLLEHYTVFGVEPGTWQA
eukprot:TRINITY_DN114859_c0_g1_i1.p1 TRINITY_DN114859_c0_g1~~TRINITY_DN114859_c0_g1_i1.p1  ORF type:complete len:102 (-),score=21.45 TRINITY_DN114859_c0_g1_i1:102-407(-)